MARDDLHTAAALSVAELERVKLFVRRHVDQAIHVDELAALTGRSASCFARLFKQATAQTPHQFILQQRVERAVLLIREDNDLSLSQIALRCGFVDQSHLTRAFQKVIGETPARFCRRRQRQD